MNKIKEYVEWYYFEHKTSPSIREIAGGIGIGKTTVFRYLQDIVFCKCKFLKFADKNGEFCISVLEKVAGCPAGLPDAS